MEGMGEWWRYYPLLREKEGPLPPHPLVTWWVWLSHAGLYWHLWTWLRGGTSTPPLSVASQALSCPGCRLLAPSSRQGPLHDLMPPGPGWRLLLASEKELGDPAITLWWARELSPPCWGPTEGHVGRGMEGASQLTSRERESWVTQVDPVASRGSL